MIYTKKLFIIYMKFKLKRVYSIFICSIWQPYIMSVTTNLVTLTGKSIGKSRDKITKADINGKSIKMQLTGKKRLQ